MLISGGLMRSESSLTASLNGAIPEDDAIYMSEKEVTRASIYNLFWHAASVLYRAPIIPPMYRLLYQIDLVIMMDDSPVGKRERLFEPFLPGLLIPAIILALLPVQSHPFYLITFLLTLAGRYIRAWSLFDKSGVAPMTKCHEQATLPPSRFLHRVSPL